MRFWLNYKLQFIFKNIGDFMKKILVALFVLCFCLTGCDNNNDDSFNSTNENVNYTAARTKYSNTASNEIVKPQEEPVETDISSFSTKIYTPNDEGRQTNIGLSCSKLNGTIVKMRRNFFFL